MYLFFWLIEWLGARRSEVTFSGKFFFSSKVPESLLVLFNLVEKHFPVIFLAGLHFVSEKNEDKILLNSSSIYLHSITNAFSFTQDLTQVLGSQHISQCGLGQQTCGTIGILYISDWHSGIVYSEINHGIYCNCHAVLCQYLKKIGTRLLVTQLFHSLVQVTCNFSSYNLGLHKLSNILLWYHFQAFACVSYGHVMADLQFSLTKTI